MASGSEDLPNQQVQATLDGALTCGVQVACVRGRSFRLALSPVATTDAPNSATCVLQSHRLLIRSLPAQPASGRPRQRRTDVRAIALAGRLRRNRR